MAIDSVKYHTLAVDEERAIGTDSDLAEAHLRATHVDDPSVGIFQRQHQVIEVRCFGTPELRSVDIHVKAYLLCGCFSRSGSSLGAVAGQDFRFHRHRVANVARQAYLHVGVSFGVSVVQVGGEEVVTNLCLRSSPQETMSLDARQAPVVLTLQERAAGEAVDL